MEFNKKEFIFQKLPLSEKFNSNGKQNQRKVEIIDMLQDYDFINKHLNQSSLDNSKQLDEKIKKLLEIYKQSGRFNPDQKKRLNLKRKVKHQNPLLIHSYNENNDRHTNQLLPDIEALPNPTSNKKIHFKTTKKSFGSLSNLLQSDNNLIDNTNIENANKRTCMAYFRTRICQTDKSQNLIRLKPLSFSLKMNDALNNIISPNIFETYQSENIKKKK